MVSISSVICVLVLLGSCCERVKAVGLDVVAGDDDDGNIVSEDYVDKDNHLVVPAPLPFRLQQVLRGGDGLIYGADDGDLNALANNTKNTKEKDINGDGVYDVIIVGAGWAGISAARALESKGITNYKILEAQDYVGGRSHTIFEDWNGVDIPLDQGSMFLHGGYGNPLYQIAVLAGISTPEFLYSGRVYKENNEGPIGDFKLALLLTELLLVGWYPLQANRKRLITDDESMQVSADLYNATLSDDLDIAVFQYFMNTLELGSNAYLSQQSLWYWENYSSPGDSSNNDLFLPGGYSQLIEAYAAAVIDNVELEAIVSKIRYNDQGVRLTYQKHGETKRVNARKAIVTVSLGVLKANTIQFIPRLPIPTQRSIARLGMGKLGKIFLIWNEEDVFWSDDDTFADVVDRDTFFYIMNPRPYNGGQPMLFAFTKGTDSEALEELYADDKEAYEAAIVELVMEPLKNIFGDDTPYPEKAVAAMWNTNEFTRGAYSFNQVYMGENDKTTLKAPVADKIYFTGEATSETYYSTTHGAHLEGKETGNIVADSLNAVI